MDRHAGTLSVPLLQVSLPSFFHLAARVLDSHALPSNQQLSGLDRIVNSICCAPHIQQLLVGKELVDCKAKARSLSSNWSNLTLGFDGTF
jgi:hypothetical protein